MVVVVAWALSGIALPAGGKIVLPTCCPPQVFVSGGPGSLCLLLEAAGKRLSLSQPPLGRWAKAAPENEGMEIRSGEHAEASARAAAPKKPLG